MKYRHILLIGLVIASAVLAACSSGPQTEQKPELNTFAQCLTDQGVIMYGTEWCPHCRNQKELFGSAFEHINYIDCEANTKACTDAGIRGYPTWIINGKEFPGEQSLTSLATRTGCTITQTN